MGPSSRASSHARLHKRGNSASSITSPSGLSPLSDAQAFAFNRSETPKVTYEEPWHDPTLSTMSASHKQIKIKPYLRKLSSKDNNTVDLSRPAEENGSLAGLGISEYGGTYRSAADVNFTGMNSRGRHNRSTSNTSQFSTSSSIQRPTAPYLPPIRQTPRPYTPPISRSTPPSLLGSENEADDIMTDEEFRLRQNAYDPARRSGSLSSVPGVAPALRIHTTGSSTRLGGSYSHSSVSLTSPIAQSRSRGDTLRSIDTTSPSSRTSFDKTFNFIRGGRDSPADAQSRAASIRAARQAFNEKEEAKERRYASEAIKQEERNQRKQYRQEEHQRRKSETHERKLHTRSRSVSDPNEKTLGTPRPSVGTRQYSDHRPAHTRLMPAIDSEKTVAQPKVTKSRAAKGRWMRFVTWFKTRLLRMRCC